MKTKHTLKIGPSKEQIEERKRKKLENQKKKEK